MKFSCDQCSAQYMIADEKVGAKGVKVKCKKCAHIIIVKPATGDDVGAASTPDKRASIPDKPAGTPSFGGSFNEPTQAMTLEQLSALRQSSGADAGNLFGRSPFGDFAGTTAAPAASSPSPSPGFGGFDTGGGSAPAGGFDTGGGSASAGGYDAAGDLAASTGFDGGGFDTGGPAAGLGAFADSAAGPAPAAGDPGFGGGFGTGFGQGFGQGSDQDLGIDRLGAAGLAAPSRAPGEKEWYVAVDESQIGPVDIAEIEQRWDAKEIDDDTLAWKAGMGDWVPVAEITELAYLVTERPQHKPVAATPGLGASSMAGSSQLAPVAFGGATGGASDVSWTPSAASALSSLVQEELTTPETQPAAAPPSPLDMGMPSFGASELFGGGNSGAAQMGAASMPAPMPGPSDPFAGGGGAWSVPKPVAAGGIKPIHLALAGMGVLLVAVVGVVVMLLLRPQPPQPLPPVAQVTPAVQPTNPVANPEVKPANNTDPQPGPSSDADDGGKRKRRKGSASAANPDPDPGPETKAKPAKSKGPVNPDLFDAPGPVKETLGKADIMGGVKKGMGAVKGCIASANSKGELTPGKHTLVLEWVIRADGKVDSPAVKGPNYVMGTSLPACFARGMRSWSFPASKKDWPVRNFPFGPFNIGP